MPKLTQGPGWSFEAASKSPVQPKTGSLAPDRQEIRIRKERRAAGKEVTIVSGLILSIRDREALARDLKQACGTGGTIKEGVIELQGDRREQVRTWLVRNGWRVL